LSENFFPVVVPSFGKQVRERVRGFKEHYLFLRVKKREQLPVIFYITRLNG
jgi:hypothetical protein